MPICFAYFTSCFAKRPETLVMGTIKELFHHISSLSLTQAQAKWAFTQFQQWLEWRNKDAAKCCLSFINVALNGMTKDEINYAIYCFICEVCKVDGSGYPGAITYEMVTNLQKYLEMNPVYHKLLTDKHFKALQLTLDEEKRRKAQEAHDHKLQISSTLKAVHCQIRNIGKI